MDKKSALNYHKFPFPGKISVNSSKKINFSYFSLAYTPGVAYPCLEIAQNPELAYEYTTKNNLVAVISNGTAILGLGNLGALASKPVMEGKSNFFKFLAGINAIDIEIDEMDPEKLTEIIHKISKTFGGINLEDISAPTCFEIEQNLIEKCDIPVFHDDQHGTAIIVLAAIQNALFLNKKNINNIKIIINGAGAAGLTCAKFLLNFGALAQNIYLFNSKGLIKDGIFGKNKESSLIQELENADVFIGLSKGNILKAIDMEKMNDNPIIFTLANPIPELNYDEIANLRKDAFFGTGGPLYPNQINNVLAFPFIFRAALDIQAKKITESMKISASIALAKLARESDSFGKNFLIPNIFDPLLIYYLTNEITKTAINEGNFNKQLEKNYEEYLENLIYGFAFPKNISLPKTSNEPNLIKLLKYKKVTKQNEKEFFSLSLEEISYKIKNNDSFLIVTQTLEIGFNNNKAKISCSSFEEFLNDDLIGIILDNEILFNNEHRIFFATKLLKD